MVMKKDFFIQCSCIYCAFLIVFITPRDYASNPDNTAMGWSLVDYNSTGKYVKGFDVAKTPVNGYVTATTMLRYINCDLAGRTINKFIPYEPSNLIWQYILSEYLTWD